MNRDETERRLLIRTMALPGQANLNGGVFGGWMLSEFDRAAGMLGMRRSDGACTTVAVEALSFLTPLRIGEEFTIYGSVISVGRSSMRLALEGWAADSGDADGRLVARGVFVSVAIDASGRPRALDGQEQAGSPGTA